MRSDLRLRKVTAPTAGAALIDTMEPRDGNLQKLLSEIGVQETQLHRVIMPSNALS